MRSPMVCAAAPLLLPCLRRLHFEAYALTAAELKLSAEATESDQPPRVPLQAELAARYAVLQEGVKPLRLLLIGWNLHILW